MTLVEAQAALRDRKISAAELTALALDRIARLNPELNAFITVTKPPPDRVIPPGPLHGIPIAHKDCFATKGIRTTGGSKILANRVPKHDAAIVEKLDQAGAVMLGKTNLHELCYGVTSTNPHFGAVHNPWDLDRIPGGSSGGSAAAVAAGLVFAATGTDTGGSIRVPASFCGVVGLKPTYGSISRRGCLPLGITLDHVGPIARTVGDVAAVFAAMGGEAPIPDKPGVAGLRIGVPENFFFDRLAPEVTASIRRAVQTIAALGAEVREVRIPHMEELNDIGRATLSAEASSLWKRQVASRPQDFGEDVPRGAGTRLPDSRHGLSRSAAAEAGALQEGDGTVERNRLPAHPGDADHGSEDRRHSNSNRRSRRGPARRQHPAGAAVQCSRLAGVVDAVRVL